MVYVNGVLMVYVNGVLDGSRTRRSSARDLLGILSSDDDNNEDAEGGRGCPDMRSADDRCAFSSTGRGEILGSRSADGILVAHIFNPRLAFTQICWGCAPPSTVAFFRITNDY